MEAANASLSLRTLSILLAGIALGAPEIASIQIPVTATVLNAPPEVLEVVVLESSVDPRSPFLIKVQVEDNNTLLDIQEVRVELASAMHEESAFTIVWTREGFDVPQGAGEISTHDSAIPADLGSPNGTWLFATILRGDAPAGSWLVRAVASDEESSSETSTIIWVNTFVSVSMAEPSRLNLTTVPGADSCTTTLRMTYTSNDDVDLLVSSTGFVGVQHNAFQLAPSAFAAWVGADRPTELSTEPRLIASALPRGSGTGILLSLSVRIPQPFYDQQYEGLVTVTLRA